MNLFRNFCIIAVDDCVTIPRPVTIDYRLCIDTTKVGVTMNTLIRGDAHGTTTKVIGVIRGSDRVAVRSNYFEPL